MKRATSDDSPWKGVLAKDIDEYLAAIPEDAREALQKLREMIHSAVPEASEAIYYRIPTFMLDGPLVGFSASKNHCSLHLMSPALVAEHQYEFRPYDTTTATIRFPADKPLPMALVTKLVRERQAENAKRAKK